MRTATPVDDLGLVDRVTAVVGRRKAGSGADRAVDIDQTAADSTDQMVMVVADPILVPGRRSGRLNAPDQPLGDEDAKGVIDRLKRDGPDLGPDDLGHAVGCDVGLAGYRPQNSQSLSRHLDTALPKKVNRVSGHATCYLNSLTDSKI